MKQKQITLHNNNNTKTTTKSTKKSSKVQSRKITNWNEYNKALAKRGNIMSFISDAIRDGVFKPVLPSHTKGHPTIYSDELILFMLTIREIFHQPLRQIVNTIHGILLANGLYYKLPDYTTLCRRAKKLEVDILPQDYCLYAGDGICYMLDSSGFKVAGAGEWIRRKWGEQDERTFIESHVGINYHDRMILSVVNTDCNVHDNTQLLPSLVLASNNLKQAKVKQNLEMIIGDGAYDAKENYHLASKLGAKFIAPPKKNSRMHMHKDKDTGKFTDGVGWEERNRVVRKIIYGDGLETWKEQVGYHRRSLNENVFFRFKTIFGERMMYRCKDSCRTEQLIRARILNIFTSYGLPRYEQIAN